jgi:hypothetical protein
VLAAATIATRPFNPKSIHVPQHSLSRLPVAASTRPPNQVFCAARQ